MKRLLFSALPLAIFLSVCSCSEQTLSPVSGDTGDAQVAIEVGKVKVLSKSMAIEFSKLCLSLSALGETTIYDTLPLSGNNQAVVTKTYSDLASMKTWTLLAKSLDARDSLIHSGSTTFSVRPRQTTAVALSLPARYSMFKATFRSIRDSVTRCELLVDGVVVKDSSFAKQSLVGNDVKLEYDYLSVGQPHTIVMNVYGDMWGIDTLLYSGSASIDPLAGQSWTQQTSLRWVGPKSPPSGQASMSVTLGSVGTIDLEGDFLSKNGILFGKGESNGLILSLWLMDGNGADRRQVFLSSTHISSASYHPDSSRLLVSKLNSATGYHEIYSVAFDGRLKTEADAVRLTDDRASYGSVSPQFINGKIWYVFGPSAGNSEIVQLDMDGSNRVQVTNFAARGKQICSFKLIGGKLVYHLQSPSWAPTAEVYVSDIDFSNEVQLTSNGEVDAWPSANQSLTFFVASHSDGGPYGFPHNLYSFDATGGSRTKLTNATGGEGYMEAYISADGLRIVASYLDNVTRKIVAMSLDGSGLVDLSASSSLPEYLYDWK